MMPQDFKTQIFNTTDQWGSGLLFRLEMLKDGGVTLYPMPTFVQWIQEVDGIKHPACIAVDECGQIYFIDTEKCRLFRYDHKTQLLERISCAGGCGSDPGKFKDPARIIIDKFTLWVLDKGNRRVQAFSRENCQLKYIMDLKDPIDIGLDKQGYLHILDKEEQNFKILTYDKGNTIETPFEVTCLKDLKNPAGVALGKENDLYILDDHGFFRFTKEQCSGPFGVFPKDFQPSTITIDKNGNIFVGDKTGAIHQFDPDGSYIGKITIPDNIQPIQGLAVDLKGNLYASTKQGIALLSTEKRFTKEEGIYYSKTLDSAIENCQWHRLSLNADLPERMTLKVYYHSSNDSTLKTRIDSILIDHNRSIQKKAEDIDREIGTWSGPEPNPKDMLFREKTGRFLWLKLILSTFDEKVRPTVKQMRVFYPRISYLRYLPAIYQEDPVSKECLERFLSIFETASHDLENEISNVFKYFDPDAVKQNFLAWLASWMNVALDEDWPEDKKRRFLREASTLYKQKGTPSGIEKLIELYTGKRPLILEHSRTGIPMVVSGKGNFRLGVNSLLLQTPVRGFRLGDDSILGRVALRDTVQSLEDPFLPMAHRFTIILNLTPDEFNRYKKGLIRILDEEKPAHTIYNLQVVKEMKVGMGTYVDDTRVADYQPIRLGYTSTIGSHIVVVGGEKGGRAELHSLLEKTLELI